MDANDILTDKRLPVFAITGVHGARSVDGLANYIKTAGWKPVEAEIKVSDVAHIARTLGGGALYSVWFAPLRELVQNAADAIDARAALDKDFSAVDGEIVVRIVPQPNGALLIEVDDNGLGMSERTLTGSLLDFGQSFWRSEAARG